MFLEGRSRVRQGSVGYPTDLIETELKINKVLLKLGDSDILNTIIMKNERTNSTDLMVNMLMVKGGTLMYHLPKEEVVKYNGCDFEFDVIGENYIPQVLHTWRDKKHLYREKYHEVFAVPEELRIQIGRAHV